MEAVGAAAAIAQLMGLSLTAGKIIRHAILSFRHAPAEITELDRKLQSFHSLVMQIASLWDELPETQTSVPLLSDHHIKMFSTSMQNISNALARMKGAHEASTDASCNVRDRLRWAVLDKKKAQSLLRNAQEADSELVVILQVLTARISSMNQRSLLALSMSQSMMHAETRKVLEEFKAIILRDGLQFKQPKLAPILPNKRLRDGSQSMRLEHGKEPRYRLIEHHSQVARTYAVASFGHGGHPTTSTSTFYGMGADITVESKRKSQKAVVCFNMAFRILGHKLIRLEVQAQLLCRSWTLCPSITSSVTIINLRPSQSSIFQACQRWDLEEVHYLLETGEASINDADNEVGGLLDHVVSGKLMNDQSWIDEAEFLEGGQSVLNYLINQGCNPSIIHGASRNSLPAILRSFQQGYRDATSMMLSSEADLSVFGDKLGGLLESGGMNESQFRWKVDLLRSIGYSDWRIGNSINDVPWGDSRFGTSWNNLNNLLHGASRIRDLDMTLFSLEIVGIDPNQVGRLNRTPLQNAAAIAWLEGIIVLLHYEACVNVNEGDYNGTPLHNSSQFGLLTSISHYLLLQGADPRLKNFQGLSVLGSIITQQYDPEFGGNLRFAYIALEGSITHLLYHGSDPSEVLATDYRKREYYAYPLIMLWFDLLGPLQASDIARFKSYAITRNGGCDLFRNELPEGLVDSINMMDDSRDFGWRFQWNGCGLMSRVHRVSSEEQPAVIEVPSVCGDTHQQCFNVTVSIDREASLPSSDAIIIDEDAFVPAWEHIDPETQDWQCPDLSDDIPSGFFRNATAFYRHAATMKGQRQLSRWPMVRALCDALQHAGYRVEMDGDGDLWYDCDDADRYFDAWETQPAEDREDWLVDVCPICQNLDEYGLGHILEIEKDTNDKIREYQRQAKEGKGRFL